MITISAVANEHGRYEDGSDEFFLARGKNLDEAKKNLLSELNERWYEYEYEFNDTEDLTDAVAAAEVCGLGTFTFENGVCNITESGLRDIDKFANMDLGKMTDWLWDYEDGEKNFNAAGYNSIKTVGEAIEAFSCIADNEQMDESELEELFESFTNGSERFL